MTVVHNLRTPRSLCQHRDPHHHVSLSRHPWPPPNCHHRLSYLGGDNCSNQDESTK